MVHPQAGEQRHLFQLNFWIKMSWGAVLGSGPLKACVAACAFRSFSLVWISQSCRQVPWWCVRGCWLWILEFSAQIRVTGTASWKRPVPLTSHKIHAFYLVQLVIFINHMDPVAIQVNTQSKMTRGSEQKACVPFLRASGPCEWPLCGTLL